MAPELIALEYPIDGVIRLRLSDPVELGAWTIVSHAGSDWMGCVGYQPGDVNEDRFSNVDDVATLVECLSGGTICDPWQSDIDRSDETTLNDLLRLVDLLSADPQHSTYLSEPLPENPCR